jgi:hypothetical protein
VGEEVRQMRSYKVCITRTSMYEVNAESEDDAIDRALEGEVEESPGGETTGAIVVEIDGMDVDTARRIAQQIRVEEREGGV